MKNITLRKLAVPGLFIILLALSYVQGQTTSSEQAQQEAIDCKELVACKKTETKACPSKKIEEAKRVRPSATVKLAKN